MKQQGYFEGWYFKQQSATHAIALIPAMHWEGGAVQKSSLQIITKDQVFVREYPFTAMEYQRNALSIMLGKNFFSKAGITLNEEGKNFSLKGQLKFFNLCPPKKDIMGPFAHIPFMQCYHSLFSMKHQISGSIELNGEILNFDQGLGYIEGDRGRSFPKEYIWTHSFFSQECQKGTGSLMLAVANIPMVVGHFTGIIGFLRWNGKLYRFATYLGAKVQEFTENSVTIEQGSFKLTATLLEGKPQNLNAPIQGDMSRHIKESLQCRARYQFYRNSELLLDVTTNKASFEFEHKAK